MTNKLTIKNITDATNAARAMFEMPASKGKTKITVHMGTCGIAAGAQKTLVALNDLAAGKDTVAIAKSGCAGLCSGEPMVTVERPGQAAVKYLHVNPKGIGEIFEKHALGGVVVEKPETKKMECLLDEKSFYGKQMEVALRNRGRIDPESLDDYLACGGYAALTKALGTMKGADVLGEVKISALRGRGGGGFPAGVKWESCVKAVTKTGKSPVVVCNADEGDPGAYMDRSLLESDPHSVIEGMLLGAYAIGASKGFVYVRKEYPLAVKVLRKAVADAKAAGLLGDGIMGTDFSFDLIIHQGAGAFVCGESTALMASMEGRVGIPRAKYIHNVESGYKDGPTVLNNVESWANIPIIIEKGGAWFAQIGTGDVSKNPWDGSSGTKVFSLVGKVERTGLVEVPMGITLREIIFEVGGGIPEGGTFKAVQTGGPSGGCLPESLLDEKVDFDTLTRAGSMMGSGGMIVMDDKTCMVDVAKYFVEFLKSESCGKCTPCREGTTALYELLTKITDGKGTEEDITGLETISRVMARGSLCQLGATAGNPVLSTLRYFRGEYEAHVKDKKCPGGVCKELITYTITDACTGCMLCAKKCPTDAIAGEKKALHVIDQDLCIKCGICDDVCKDDAVRIA